MPMSPESVAQSITIVRIVVAGPETERALRDALDLILVECDRALAALERRAQEHKRTVCVGRTHGIHAEPTSFGLRLAGFAFEADRNLERLRRAFEQASAWLQERRKPRFCGFSW